MKCVIYARYSSAEQREESVEGQLRECKEFAERHNMTVIDSYIDRALSARTDDRPQFQKMIQDSAKKQFKVVLVWKLDRFCVISIPLGKIKKTIKAVVRQIQYLRLSLSTL